MNTGNKKNGSQIFSVVAFVLLTIWLLKGDGLFYILEWLLK